MTQPLMYLFCEPSPFICIFASNKNEYKTMQNIFVLGDVIEWGRKTLVVSACAYRVRKLVRDQRYETIANLLVNLK